MLSCSAVSNYASPWTAARQAPSVHGISQARILEWADTPSSRGPSPTQGSNPHLLCLGRQIPDQSHQGSLGKPAMLLNPTGKGGPVGLRRSSTWISLCGAWISKEGGLVGRGSCTPLTQKFPASCHHARDSKSLEPESGNIHVSRWIIWNILSVSLAPQFTSCVTSGKLCEFSWPRLSSL